jgi:hypothetical protein
MGIPYIEVAAGPIDGSNLVFTVSRAYQPLSTAVFLNGQLKVRTNADGWAETSPALGSVTLNQAPLVGDVVEIYYLDTSPTLFTLGMFPLSGTVKPIGDWQGALVVLSGECWQGKLAPVGDWQGTLTLCAKSSVAADGSALCSDDGSEAMACLGNTASLGPVNSLTIIGGTSQTLALTVTDCAGNTVDITGVRIIFTVKNCLSDPLPLFQKDSNNPLQIELNLPRLGQALIYLQPADTQGLCPGEYVYDVWAILPTGQRFALVLPTPFIIKGGLTYLPP